MPSFDIESSYDKQEVTNAVDQTSREINTRYDFKNTKNEKLEDISEEECYSQYCQNKNIEPLLTKS